MFGLGLGVLAKILLGLPGLADKALDTLKQRSDADLARHQAEIGGDVALNQAAIAGYVEERRIIAQERSAQAGSPATRWMIPTAFGLCLLHFGAIVLDSTFRLDWRIDKLPGAYADLEQTIILAVIGKAAVQDTVRRWIGRAS